MYILWNGNRDRPEIEISDSAQGLIKFGELLVNISENLDIRANPEKQKFYPENLDAVSIRLIQVNHSQNLDLLKIFLINKTLVIEGSKLALDKLGGGILNCFPENSPENSHFHFDYFEGDPLLAPTNCSIIVACIGQVTGI